MTQEKEEHFKKLIIVDFVIKYVFDKVRDLCHLTSKYRGPAHNTCNVIVTEKQINFIPIVFHKLSNIDCHLLFKK